MRVAYGSPCDKSEITVVLLGCPMTNKQAMPNNPTLRRDVLPLLALLAVLFSSNQAQTLNVPPKPMQTAKLLLPLLGEYASATETLYVAEEKATLLLITKKQQRFPLAKLSTTTYSFTGQSVFNDTLVVFSGADKGTPLEIRANKQFFKRLTLGGNGEAGFTIKPLKPVSELRIIALASEPPVEKGSFWETDFIELSSMDSSIKYDIRYATKDNFLGEAVYEQAKALLQRPAAYGLLNAHRQLRQFGFGLLIHDAYRPWYVTKIFWDATPDDKKVFVADPSKGSRHNRGCAVDCSLYDLKTGIPVEMTGGYDEMSERSYPSYPGGTSLQRWHRDLLRKVMESNGFVVYEWEWWHFDYKDWKKYPIGTKTFEEILK
jgi:D-alanyl-D-alanine dipeptidase